MKKSLSFIFCIALVCAVCSGCGAGDKGTIVQNGIHFKSVTYIENTDEGRKETPAYQVVGCDEGITLLEIPDYVNGIPVLGFRREAFLNNMNLTEVVIPDTITTIALNVAPFKGCNNIEKVTAAFDEIMQLFVNYGSSDYHKGDTIPASLHVVYLSHACTNIGWREFYYCTNLKEIHIPNSVTEIKDGTNLTVVGVNGNAPHGGKFENLPFIGCTNLSIYCEASAKPEGFEEYWNYIDAEHAAPVYWNSY